ncbi:MAG: alpha/beta hydrolase [Alphaproteobacteria bacterium]
MKNTKPAILMVHGAFAGGWAFDKFRTYFEARGYVCLSPDLRHHTRSARALPVRELGHTSLLDYAHDLEILIKSLDAPPVLMGHSMGGLLCQILAARGLGSRMVLLAPSPPSGITPSSSLEQMAAFGIFASGMGWGQMVEPDFDTAATHALSHMPGVQQRKFFEMMTAESGTALFEIMCWMLDMRGASRVNAKNVTCPVLALAGSADPINSPATVRQIARRYGERASYHCFNGVSHWLLDGPRWRETALYCSEWLARPLKMERSDAAVRTTTGE